MDTKEKAQIGLSVLGILISIYLTVAHYIAALPVVCPTVGVIDCGTVLSSSYSVIFGIPSSSLGIAFFVVFMALLLYKKHELALYWSTIGFVMLFYFWYAEYTLGKICLYCTALHIIVIVLLASMLLGEHKK
ncbi:MAG: vitamin K epoxide reductase family protein [Candidatus Micrarchaeota archaeon]|nr:vitamin K epoxide reductase family protein [Candidatus Micrarchaeota archaeon]